MDGVTNQSERARRSCRFAAQLQPVAGRRGCARVGVVAGGQRSY